MRKVLSCSRIALGAMVLVCASLRCAVAAETVYLKVESKPSGATVHVDGRYIGVSPVRLPVAVDRTYAVKVIKFGFQPFIKSVEVSTEDVAVIAALAGVGKGSLAVESEPSEAEVLLDGTSCGETPLIIEDVEAGKHDLRIQKSNFILWQDTITVTAGRALTIHRKLMPRFIEYYAEAIAADPDDLENYTELANQCILHKSFTHGRGAVITALELATKQETMSRSLSRITDASEKMHWEEASPKDVELLAELLGADSTAIRKHVLECFESIPPSVGIPALLGQLRRRDYQLRRALVAGLGTNGNDASREKPDLDISDLTGAVAAYDQLIERVGDDPYQVDDVADQYADLAARFERFLRIAGNRPKDTAELEGGCDTVWLPEGDRIDAHIVSMDPSGATKMTSEVLGGKIELPTRGISSMRFSGGGRGVAEAPDRVHLAGDNMLSGKVLGYKDGEWRFDPVASDEIVVDRSLVKSVMFESPRPPVDGGDADKDRLYFVNGNRLSGEVLEISDRSCRLDCVLGELKLDREVVAAVRLAARERPDDMPEKTPEDAVEVGLMLPSGDCISGILRGCDDKTVTVATDFAGELRLDRGELRWALLTSPSEWSQPFENVDLEDRRQARGEWSLRDGALIGSALTQRYCSLRSEPVPVDDFMLDVGVEFLDTKEEAAVAISMAQDADRRNGYSLRLTENGLSLGSGWMGRQRVALSSSEPRPGGPQRIRLIRRGLRVSVFLNGQPAFHTEVEQPISANSLSLNVLNARAAFTGVRIRPLNAPASKEQ